MNKKIESILLITILIILCLVNLSHPFKRLAESNYEPTATPQIEQSINASHLINTLLADGTCELPCWWGFYLGEDDISVSRDKIENNLNLSDISETTVSTEPPYTVIRMPSLQTNPSFSNWDIEGDVNLFLIFDPQTDILSKITLHIYEPAGSYINWHMYSPSQILNQYGMPERVGFIIDFDRRVFYHLILDYEHIGLKIEYMIPISSNDITFTNDRGLICNTFQSYRIVIEIYQDMGLSSEITDVQVNWLDEVSGLTIEEFTWLFSQENSCIAVYPIEA